MKQILTVVVLVSIVAVACGPNATPTTPPDLPLFADGEAIAVVKTRLSGMTYDMVQQLGSALILSSIIGREAEQQESIVVQRNCLALYKYYEFLWSSEYLGSGVWTVTAESVEIQDSATEWRVFEGTRAVDQITSSSFPLC